MGNKHTGVSAPGKFYFDTTKWQRQKGHHSGLNRVSSCLQKSLPEALGERFTLVRWSKWRRSYVEVVSGNSVKRGTAGDVLFTPEQFALKERLGGRKWLRSFKGKRGILYYDSIPFEYPETTWPKSVRRFSAYFQDLSEYDAVLYISEAARDSAKAVSRKSGWPFLDGGVIPMGADHLAAAADEKRSESASNETTFLNVGILEWRKGQDLIVEACKRLQAEGQRFRMVFIGRKNPHFGEKVVQAIEELGRSNADVVWHEKATDELMQQVFAARTVLVLPSRAEGYGLPVVEGLARGLPVICSEQPCLEDAVIRAGVSVVDPMSVEALAEAMRAHLSAEGYGAAVTRARTALGKLPTWKASAEAILAELA